MTRQQRRARRARILKAAKGVVELRFEIDPRIQSLVRIAIGTNMRSNEPELMLKTTEEICFRPKFWWRIVAFFIKGWKPKMKVRGLVIKA